MKTIIVAFDENFNIGKNNSIPWNFPEDLINFKKLTTNNVCIMGRKTWESLPNKFRPLPNRMNIVVSSSYYRNPDNFIRTLEEPPSNPFDAFAVFDLEDAINYCEEYVINKEIFIIGGAKIYKESIDKNYVDKMIVTRVKGSFDGDVKFPIIDWASWNSKTLSNNPNFEVVEFTKK
jgi:dihydrofolate reductase